MITNIRIIGNDIPIRKSLNVLIIILAVFIVPSCSTTLNSKEVGSLTQTENSIDYGNVQVTPVDYQYNSKETFKLLSWNVEHFVDDFDDPYIAHPRENNPEPEMGNKVTYLAEALRIQDADIVLLQEFESTKLLRQFAEDHLAGMGYKYFASAPSDNWYMNVVVMSKFPLGVLYSYGNVTTPVVDYRDENGLPESQNNLNTRMWSLEVYPTKDYNFILTGLHLKAGRGERNEATRIGQIIFLKHQFLRFLKMNPSQNLLVAGDLNITLGSNEIRALQQGKNAKDTFYDPLPENVLSHPANDPSRRLDYILFNGNMQKEYLSGSAQIPFVFNPEKMRAISDHLPLISTFKKTDQ